MRRPSPSFSPVLVCADLSRGKKKPETTVSPLLSLDLCEAPAAATASVSCLNSRSRVG